MEPLSTKKFYVYVYLDPRKPGNWNFNNIKFEYMPFYIGKGSNNRIKYHLYHRSKSKNIYKTNLINKIIKETGNYPIHYKIYNNIDEKTASILEIELIKHFGRVDNKSGILLNMTDGGEGFKNIIRTPETLLKIKNSKKGKCMRGKNPNSKPVIQYDLDNNIVKKWESILDIIDSNNHLSAKKISKACKTQSIYYNFKWKFEPKSKLIYGPTFNKNKNPVYQYDLHGNFIKKYNSRYEAECLTGIRHINDCCNGKINHAGNYKWFKSFLGDKIPPPITQQKKVYQYTKTGEFIKEYNSINQIKRELGINNVAACCNGHMTHAGGFIWSFYKK